MRDYAVRPKPEGGLELWSWFFMRVSGLLLFALALGHLAIMHIIHSVEEVNYAFVALRFTTPFWRIYDLLLLTLALLHGSNGIRIIIDDYARSERQRRILVRILYVLAVLFFVGGTWVLIFFNPVI